MINEISNSNLIGQKFGKLTPIEKIKKNSEIFYNCKCDCGNFKIAKKGNLVFGHSKSCGCLHKEKSKTRLIGKRFEKLLVIDCKIVDDKRIWICKCDCGNIFDVKRFYPGRGPSSCGCSKYEHFNRRYQDTIIGTQIGRFKVLELLNEKRKGLHLLKCECSCGNVVNKTLTSLKFQRDKPCKCGNKIGANQTYGLLTTIERSNKQSPQRKYWICKCRCGKQTEVEECSLRHGATRSCGCYAKSLQNPNKNLNRKDALWKSIYLRSIKFLSKKNGYESDITVDDFRSLCSQPCFYCGKVKSNKRYDTKCKYASKEQITFVEFNGLDKINPSRGYFLDNVRPCCKSCNTSKLNMSESDFKQHIINIYNNWASK